MKPFRRIFTIVCIVASFIATAGEELTAKVKGAVNQPTAAELQLLHGTWEGFMVGAEADGKITITVTGNSLHFHRNTNFWFETIITLPAGTDPKQLHATIKDSANKKSIDEVVPAIYKIEDGTLTLAAYAMTDEPPKTFNSNNLYVVKKVEPQKKNVEPAKTK